MFHEGREFSYEFCELCQCIRLLNPVVDPSELYPNHYHSFTKRVEEHYSKPSERKNLELLKKRFEREKDFLPDQPVLSLLRRLNIQKQDQIADIGCGEGELLYLLRELGFVKTEGFDPFIEKSVCYSNGLKIQKTDLFSIQDTFDWILLNHSFEHMMEPIPVLLKLRDLMKEPQGRLLIRIPLVNQAWKLYREYWYQLDPPRHVFLYSIRGLAQLLQKTGLEIEQTLFDSTVAQITLSEKNFYRFNPKDGKYFLKRIFKIPRKSLLKRRVAKWNQQGLGDQAAFVIKKQKPLQFDPPR